VNISISNNADTPIYKQIYDQISGQILRGELDSDETLPSIRAIALELRISVITIKKAWEELEKDGLIYTVLGKGCFIASVSAKKLQNKRDEFAQDKIKKDIKYYKELGLSRDELIRLVNDHFDEK